MNNLICCALASVLLGTAASAQTTVDLSLGQARDLGMQALVAGDGDTALQVARAILSQAPDDRTALLIVAAAAPQQGNAAAGRRAGARAYAVSQTDPERYEAARLTALAAANGGQFTRATWWLRRALIVAPSDADRNQTLADARLVQQRNPWSFDVTASLAPSSNVNGGAADGLASAPGNPTGILSPDALALAGWRGALGLGLAYRLDESATMRSVLSGRYQINRVRITDASSIPDAAFGSDFAELTLRHDRALGRGSIGAQVTLGRVSYRDYDSITGAVPRSGYDTDGVRIDWRVPLGSAAEFGFALGRDRSRYDNPLIGTVQRDTAQVSVAGRVAAGDTVRVALSYADSTADNRNYVAQEWSVQGAYRVTDPVGPVTLGLNGGVTWADFPDYTVLTAVTGGRQDTTLFYGVTLGFSDVSYAGFTPELTLSGTSAASNVSRFTRDSLSVGVSLRSVF